MKSVLSFDAKLCTGCRVCEIACSLRHTGVNNPARARLRLVKNEDTGYTHMNMCHRCKKAPCMEACPVNAITKAPETGVIVIDRDKCIGCLECIEACPFNAMFLDPVTEDLISCDLCDGDPACCKFCSIGAIVYRPVGAPREKYYEMKLEQAFSNPVIRASVYKEEDYLV